MNGRSRCAEPPGQALTSPAVARNKAPILAVLRSVLPREGRVLEIASGSGEHALHFASALGSLDWFPSDPDPACRRSIDAWARSSRQSNLHEALALDVCSQPWPLEAPVEAIVCINMIHIAPWPATAALFAGADRWLSDAGVIFMYGPYRVHGSHTAPSNEEFDRSLRERNPQWGVRDLDEVARVAGRSGFALDETIAMPANNLSVVFRRARRAR